MTRWTEIVSRRADVYLTVIAFLVSYADTEAAPTDVVISDTTAAVRELELLFSKVVRKGKRCENFEFAALSVRC